MYYKQLFKLAPQCQLRNIFRTTNPSCWQLCQLIYTSFKSFYILIHMSWRTIFKKRLRQKRTHSSTFFRDPPAFNSEHVKLLKRFEHDLVIVRYFIRLSVLVYFNIEAEYLFKFKGLNSWKYLVKMILLYPPWRASNNIPTLCLSLYGRFWQREFLQI